MLKPYLNKSRIEAGCDEAGRGCLAGPVFAAAVILPKGFRNKLLNDSKKLTEKERDYLRPVIEKEALDWAVAFVDNYEIDKINILNASFLAMHRAISKLKIVPESLLIDGNRFNSYKNIQHHCIIKGDEKFLSIAAASILAKTHRDACMQLMHMEYPHYGWNQNKAYCTKLHREAISLNGVSPYHRMSFTLIEPQLELPF
jgi:ribonuclease HII